MAELENNTYLTITKNGMRLGNKNVTKYQGKEINCKTTIEMFFEDIQRRKSQNISEVHVLSSETPGEYAKPGDPSGKTGPYVWCRIKYKDGKNLNGFFVLNMM